MKDNERPTRSGPSRESPCDRRLHILSDVHRSELQGAVRVQVQTRRGLCPGLRVFGAEHLHHLVPRLCAPVLRLEDSARLPFVDTPHRRPELPAEHQAMIGLCPVLRRSLSLGDG